MRAFILLAAACSALILSGCSGGPVVHVKQVSPPALDPGWGTATSPDGSVSIGIAPGWGKGMADQLSTNDMIGMAGGELPQAALEQQQRALDEEYEDEIKGPKATKDGLLVSIVDRQNRPTFGEQRTRYTVKFKDMHSGLTLQEAGAEFKNDIMGEGEPKTVNLPIGPALRFDASIGQRDGGTVNRIMYVIVDGSKGYSVTFTTQSPIETVGRIAEPVMQTLRIKPSKD